MKKLIRFIFHPIFMVMVINVAWTTALVFWILFFIRRYRQVAKLAKQTGVEVTELVSWAPLVLGILLLAFIFGGTVMLTIRLLRQYMVNRQMRNFLSFVSHELRTPLTSIHLMLETMRDNELSAPDEDLFIERMLLDSQRLTQQISGILDASRLENRRMLMRKQLIELDKLIKDYWREKNPEVKSAGHELEIGNIDYCSVLGNRDALLTVIDNLVRNAQRYSSKGSRITISLATDDKWATIKVSDEGIGINPKEKKKIFKLFYRGESGIVKSRRGSGLGLYIVKGIVRLLGGAIEVLSEPGKGATFIVKIPKVSDK